MTCVLWANMRQTDKLLHLEVTLFIRPGEKNGLFDCKF